MPLLDVSEVLADPLFCEEGGLVILRRAESINTYGESVQTAVQVSPNPNGVVTAGAAKPMVRGEDGETNPNTITVHALDFRLVGPADGYQPDIIVWQGSQYVVVKVYDYSLYGAGFTSADCDALPLVDTVTP